MGSGVTVTPLVCPDCGSPLAGLRYDRIFNCMNCRMGYKPGKEGKWTRYALRFAEPGHAKAKVSFYLPLWQLGIESSAKASNKQQEVAISRIEDMKSVWVTAFTMVRPSYYGDIGLNYSSAGAMPRMVREWPQASFTAGCARTLEDASKYARLFVTLFIDKRTDVTGMEIDVKVTGAALWGIPFADQGSKVMDLVSGMELPAFAIDDLAEIRRIASARKGD